MPVIRNILVVCRTEPRHRVMLEEALPEASFTYAGPDSASEEAVAKAEAIFGNLPPERLKSAARLKFLQLNSAGTDGYTAPGALPNGVLLANATGGYGPGIAEYMLGVLLSLCKKLHRYRDQQHRALWQPLGEVRAVAGMTVLVVGLGDIGREFAGGSRRWAPLSSESAARGTEKPGYVDELRLTEQLDELIPRADVVALCLPGTAGTRNIMNRGRISEMKQGAILINVGRGTALDSEALCDALDAGKLWGAALDVTDPEPLPAESRLWNTENLILTPHVSGGFTLPETHDRVVRLAAENLAAFAQGLPVKSIVDLETGYRKL